MTARVAFALALFRFALLLVVAVALLAGCAAPKAQAAAQAATTAATQAGAGAASEAQTETGTESQSGARVAVHRGRRHFAARVEPAADGGAPSVSFELDDEPDDVEAGAEGEADAGAEGAADAGSLSVADAGAAADAGALAVAPVQASGLQLFRWWMVPALALVVLAVLAVVKRIPVIAAVRRIFGG